MTPFSRIKLIQDKTVFISCVVPVYNEQANADTFFPQLADCLSKMTNQFEIIVVDDGSKDDTIAKIMSFPKELNIKLLGFSRNFGKETALTAGLEHCSGDVTILMDADFQHPLDVLPKFLAEWGTGYDMVYGVRQNRDTESRIKRNFARLFYFLMGKIY